MLDDVNQTSAQPVAEETLVTKDVEFRSLLPEDLRDDPSLQDFKDIAGLAKSYVHSKQMLGNSIRIPTDDASAEVRADFYKRLETLPNVAVIPSDPNSEAAKQFFKKLGRPDDPSKYKFNIPADLPVDQNLIQNFSDYAYQAGLTQQQADAMVQYELQREQHVAAASMEHRALAEKALRSKWGSDFENRLNGAKAAVQHYASGNEAALQELVQGPAGNNPVFIEMLSDMYSSLQEQGVVKGTSTVSYGITPAEAMQRINEMRNNSAHPIHDTRHPQHAAAVQKMSELYSIVHGEGSHGAL